MRVRLARAAAARAAAVIFPRSLRHTMIDEEYTLFYGYYVRLPILLTLPLLPLFDIADIIYMEIMRWTIVDETTNADAIPFVAPPSTR